MIVVETLMAQDLELGVETTSKTHASGGTLNGHQISLSTFSVAGASGEASSTSWSPGTLDAGDSVTTTITVTGAAMGDFVLRSFNSALQGLTLTADVTAANTVTAVLFNGTGDAVVVESGTLRVLVFKTR